MVLQASTARGSAAEAYEDFKRSYLDTANDCMAQGFSFIPKVAEPSGGWGPSGLCTLKALARAEAEALVSGSDEGVVLAGYFQRLCTAIRKTNARALLRRRVSADIPSPQLADAASEAVAFG